MSGKLTIKSIQHDLSLLIILFLFLRVSLLIAFQPIYLDTGEYGITRGGDYLYYYQLAQLTEEGALPFREWWSEFPPLWSVVQVGLYQLLGVGANYTAFATLLAMMMIVSDLGILFFTRSIAIRLYGNEVGETVAWVYALLPVGLIQAFWSFEPLMTVCLLGCLLLLLQRNHLTSAFVMGIGALLKFIPIVFIGAVVRFFAPRVWLRYGGVLALTVGLPYAILLSHPATQSMTRPSLTAQFGKASYQTVWALLDGNYTTGIFGAPSERFDPTKATLPRGNPAVISSVWRLLVGGLVGLAVFLGTRRTDERGILAFSLLTLLIFYLQSQGWSPQWLVGLIPLMLLTFPTRLTVLVVVLLGTLALVEYPLLFIRTGDTGGVINGEWLLPYISAIGLRTLLLLGFCVALIRLLWQTPVQVEGSGIIHG